MDLSSFILASPLNGCKVNHKGGDSLSHNYTPHVSATCIFQNIGCKGCGGVNFIRTTPPDSPHKNRLDCSDCGRWYKWASDTEVYLLRLERSQLTPIERERCQRIAAKIEGKVKLTDLDKAIVEDLAVEKGVVGGAA